MQSLPNELLSLSDEDVLARIAGGEARLFEVLMRRYNRRLFRAARAIVRSNDEAEDVVQETYVRAYAALATFEGRARLSTWLTRICVHEAIARQRRLRRFDSWDDEDGSLATGSPDAPVGAAPDARVDDAELRRLLESRIDALPEKFRAVLVLRSVEELTVEETAESLGLPEETVRTRHFRARALLQRELARAVDRSSPTLFDFHLSRCDRIVHAVLERMGLSPIH